MTKAQIADLKPGDILRDENDNRYLIVRICHDRKCIEVMDNHFDKCCIGFKYIKYYYYYESTNLNFYKAWFSGEPDTNDILTQCYQIIGEYNEQILELTKRIIDLEERIGG